MGSEEVDRHLARLELGELEREVDALLERLAHAEDAAAAQLHAGVDREPRGLDAVVVGVRACTIDGNSARGASRLWL